MHFIRSRYGYLTGILGLLTLLGCGSSSKHAAVADARAYLQWNIYDLGGTTPLHCSDVGATKVVANFENIDILDTYSVTFACADYQDYTDYLPSGDYKITVDLYDAANFLLYEATSLQPLYSGSNTLPVVYFDVNSFVLGWSISYNGVSTTCAAVGANWVALDVYYPGETQPTSYYLACDDSSEYRAATAAIEMGPYAIKWQAFLLDANDNELTTGTQLMSYNVSYSTQADLGTVYFAF
jgi:hypothetical protein